MWAQMLKTRVKAGQEETLRQLPQEMEARFRAGGGPDRVLVMQEENDPTAYITVIFFESEAKAREYEGSAQQHEVQQRMMQIWAGPPQFTDLNVVSDMHR